MQTPGGPVPIERLKVGDLVLSVDELTGQIGKKPVTALLRPEAKPLYAVNIVGSTGAGELFQVTDDHPWKVHGKGWLPTRSLRPRDQIETGSGSKLSVASVSITGAVDQTFNLTVADWHTFLVGQAGALVHNANCWSLSRERASQVRNHARGWGTFYRTFPDSLGNVYWWVKDNAGHGWSAYKVFREGATGSSWIADADKHGDYIDGKHKGDIGGFIPWQDLGR